MSSHHHFASFPRAATAAEYRRASEEIEGYLASLPGLVSVYRTGTVSVPGVSDLDRIAVVEDGCAPVPAIWPRLSAATRYAALHSPFLVDVTTFRAHRWFAHVEPLELAAGKMIALLEPADRRSADLQVAAEGLVTLALKLLKQARTGRVKVRSALCELHALRFSLQLGGLDEDAAPVAWHFAHEVRAARQTWFDLTAEKRTSAMASLSDTAGPAVTDALLALDLALRERHRDLAAIPFELRAAWANVTLDPCTEVKAATALGRALEPPPLSSLLGRSRRMAELRWRSTDHTLPVPAAVVDLLRRAREDSSPFHAERRRVVADYRRFMTRTDGTYASLCFAGSFA